MPGLYLLLLTISITCLGLIDMRYKLVFFRNKHLSLKIIGACIMLFILWDALGIYLDIFFVGKTDYLIGLNLGEFPVEEIFFLVLLNYTALILSQYLKVKRGLS